jgi:DNA helicase-2/ATP-dependent DNA helicase PcrA
MAEERRLFYVGMTRAKNQLYLLRSERRANFGTWEYSEASRFLDDISDELMLAQGKRSTSRRDARLEDMRWSSTTVPSSRRTTFTSNSTPREPRYKPGMRVSNSTWGEGLVIDSKLDPDGEETVDVHFETVGFKRLLASLANLEILS